MSAGAVLPRIGHRFLAAFTLLLFLPQPLDVVPGIDMPLNIGVAMAWQPLLLALGHVLGLEVPPLAPSGSADGLGAWLKLLACAGLALPIAVPWARRVKSDDLVVADVTRDYVRVIMVVAMCSYGFQKVFCLQFSPLTDLELSATYAESSPMGLLWRFMGYSPAYQRITGLIEVLGGLLLISRRTTSLGAIISFAAMTNVVLLNFCFDVPVKIPAVTYWVCAAVLAHSDAMRVLRFLVLRQSHAASEEPVRYCTTPKLRWVRLATPAVVALLVCVGSLRSALDDEQEPEAVTELKGSFAVLSQSPTTTWSRVTMTGEYFIAPAAGAGQKTVGQYSANDSKHLMHFKTLDEPAVESTLTWARAGDDLLLRGTMGQQPVDVRLRKVDALAGPLMNRGVHLVQQAPFIDYSLHAMLGQ